jgi:2-polyprenyl-6-methoxyphenol hydroxylase-like FAD-dependent oxidoreductase
MNDNSALPQGINERAISSVEPSARLSALDVLQWPYIGQDKALDGLKVTVIGAGPAGLVFARSAIALGANVTILEKAGDPRDPDAGYLNRSFNITLDEVGRHVLADNRIWKDDGVWLVGRAVHNRSYNGSIDYADYPETAKLVSIPRPTLRRNMVIAALQQGVTIHFHSHVTNIDPDMGTTTYLQEDGREGTIDADLVVIADGLHSIGDKFRSELYGED